jgi:ribonucleoside-diphosphate reductase alpha chain
MSEDKVSPVEILSDITTYMKYRKYVPDLKRRETWDELVHRNMQMHVAKFPDLKEEIEDVYNNFVRTKKVLASMRSFQFAGKPIDINNSRIYNCSYAPVETLEVFSEFMFLLLGGTGVGYSVQKHHVEKLPPLMGTLPLEKRERARRYLVGDSIEGWSDAIKVLINSYFKGKKPVEFDLRDIRPKGARLITSGGKAPGAGPLRECITQITNILENALQERGSGTQLKPIEAHDIVCHIADAVLAGGIRRAALISLFSFDDEEMISSKSGAWYELNPQRGRANNSVFLMRDKIEEQDFKDLWKKVELSGSGEPGFYFSNDEDWGTNPCCEIALKPYQMCNLTEINAATVLDQNDLNERSKAAAFLGTLQASYSNFHYLRPIWQKTVEKDALLGVSMTGIASPVVLSCNLEEAAKVAVEENKRVAQLIGINPASRVTAVKPSGTTSLVLGTSSGIHAWHNDYYIRRVRVGKNEAIYKYLSIFHPELVEDEYFRPKEMAVISVPQKAPEGAILRTESPLDTLERVKLFSKKWVKPGHIKGKNTHNVSCTISIKDEEWPMVGEWMWSNRNIYNGISVLNYNGGSYTQAPFEDITEEKYNEMLSHLLSIDLSQIIEDTDETDVAGEIACGPAGCEVV